MPRCGCTENVSMADEILPVNVLFIATINILVSKHDSLFISSTDGKVPINGSILITRRPCHF